MNPKHRTKNVALYAAGGVAVALPAALATTGTIAPTAAAAAAGAAVTPLGLRAWFKRRTNTTSDRPATHTSDNDVLEQLDTLCEQIKGKVPALIEARTARIARTVHDIVPRIATLGIGSSAAHTVISTATSYLPEALDAYMRLPRNYADRRAISGGKTSLMVLCDQLDLLGAKMDEALEAVLQSDVDALIAHGQFLKEKFSTGHLDSGTTSHTPGNRP